MISSIDGLVDITYKNDINNVHCCMCGEPRLPAHKPVPSFSNNVECLAIADYRPLQEGRWEASPQLLVNVCIWRNGGADPAGNTHICDACIVVGLQAAKLFVDESLFAFSTERKIAKVASSSLSSPQGN
jgi:hypothetical protein